MTIKREDLNKGRIDFTGVAAGKKTHVASPGEILKEDYLDEYGLSISAAASAMKISRARLNEIVRGERGITADTALRLGKFFGNSAQFWMNLQTHYDLVKARVGSGRMLRGIRQVDEVAHHA